jgi:diadenosine tetraphosphate (Ap4A) HIT family hydrolase
MSHEYDEQNIFAKILRGEVSSYQIFENDHAVAILDAFPICPGHALLLPKAPCVSMLDMPAELASSYLASLPKVRAARRPWAVLSARLVTQRCPASLAQLASIVQRATGAPAVKIVTNSGAEAGQIVFHCHFHVVPRFGGSGETMASSGPLKPEDAAEMLRRMRELSAPPFSRVLAALDNLIGEMRRGDVHHPAAAVKPTYAPTPSKPAKASSSPAEPKPSAVPAPPTAPSGDGPVAAPASDRPDKKAAKKAAQEKAAVKAAAAGGGAAAKPGGEADADRPVDVSWLDIRVGEIHERRAQGEEEKNLWLEAVGRRAR